MIHRDEIVEYWAQLRQPTHDGMWVHPDDAPLFRAHPHSFNLQFPVSPYVGDILNAKAIILGANAGYNPTLTPSEFPDDGAVQAYVRRVHLPSEADWGFVSFYYNDTNYGEELASGKAALINASPYRSRKISDEPDNRKLIELLPSTRMHRRWLRSAILPLARSGEIRLIAKRFGLWKMTLEEKTSPGVFVDKAPVSPLLTGAALSALKN